MCDTLLSAAAATENRIVRAVLSDWSQPRSTGSLHSVRNSCEIRGRWVLAIMWCILELSLCILRHDMLRHCDMNFSIRHVEWTSISSLAAVQQGTLCASDWCLSVRLSVCLSHLFFLKLMRASCCQLQRRGLADACYWFFSVRVVEPTRQGAAPARETYLTSTLQPGWIRQTRQTCFGWTSTPVKSLRKQWERQLTFTREVA